MGFKSKIQEIKSRFLLVSESIIKLKIWKLFNVPNFLTLIRLLLIVPFILNILNDHYLRSFKVLLLSGLTDMLDGVLARLLQQETQFGIIFDPLVDKLTLLSIMTCLGIKFPTVVPFVIILILKELIMLLAGIFMVNKYKFIIKSKWYGKIATVIFYFSVIVIIGMKCLWNIENEFTINVLMWSTSLLMMFALIKYTIEFIIIVLSQKKRN